MVRPHSHSRPDPRGVALCLASAVGFAALAIFAKEAYAGGANIPTLLAVRFTLAAAVLWALVARSTPRRVVARAAPRRVVALGPPRAQIDKSTWAALALGVLYAVEASVFFFALSRIDAALAELLLFAYPALVIAGAALLGRERLSRGRLQALALSTLGTALVLAAGEISTLDAVGVLAAVGSACLYAGYVLASDRVVDGGDPLRVAALVATSAAVCFVAYGTASGSLDLELSARAWVATLAIALLSTVVPIVAFLRGMQLVGVSTATLVSTIEPVVSVGLAMVVLGERLAPVQLLGGALVVGALVLLARSGVHEPAVDPADPAPARPAREEAAVGA